MSSEKNLSYIKLIGSMLIFGTIGIFRRYIPLPSATLAFARGILGAAFLLCFLKLKGKSIRNGTSRKTVFMLALTGVMIGINWILLFEAYNYTTVATATLCYYMQPTIVILLSPLVFREKLTAKKLICAALAIVGMVFVSGIADDGGAGISDPKGILVGLGAAAFYSAVVIMNKRFPVDDAYEKTVIQLSSAAIVLIPYLLLTGGFAVSGLNAVAIIMILVVGIVHTGFAYALYFGSMNALPAQSIAVLSYIDPVSALILSALILHESMTVWGIIGAVLIIGSALISELEPRRK